MKLLFQLQEQVKSKHRHYLKRHTNRLNDLRITMTTTTTTAAVFSSSSTTSVLCVFCLCRFQPVVLNSFAKLRYGLFVCLLFFIFSFLFFLRFKLLSSTYECLPLIHSILIGQLCNRPAYFDDDPSFLRFFFFYLLQR